MPKKNSKAALKKKQKKQKSKAKQQKQQNKQNGKNNGTKNDPSITGGQADVLQMTGNPDDHLKEFNRDINIHNFSRKQNTLIIYP